jgi:hypothetical protein
MEQLASKSSLANARTGRALLDLFFDPEDEGEFFLQMH